MSADHEAARERLETPQTADRTHVPEREAHAYNQRPKARDIAEAKLYRYDGTNLHQWYCRSANSVFWDAFGEPFVISELDRRRAPQPVGERVREVVSAWIREDLDVGAQMLIGFHAPKLMKRLVAALASPGEGSGNEDKGAPAPAGPSGLASGRQPSLEEPESAAGADIALVTTTCFECGHDLEGPWCPACNPRGPMSCQRCARGEITGCDDGSWVELDWTAGGAHKTGLYGSFGLIFHEADGSERRRTYVATAPTPPPRSEAEAVQEAGDQPQDTDDLGAANTLQGAQGDPAGSAPAYPAPWRGEVRVLDGKLCRFIEPDDKGDVWEVLGPAPLPAPHRDADGLKAGGE